MKTVQMNDRMENRVKTVNIPDSDEELEARIKILEDNMILLQQMNLENQAQLKTLTKKHNDLIDILSKKGIL
jgi:flagellar biosynthesis/type III secretory pathway chaperone